MPKCHPTKPAAKKPWAFFLLAAALLAGCSAKPKNFNNENDALRRQLVEVRAENEKLRARTSELEAKLAEAIKVSQSRSGVSADVVDAIPRCAGIKLDKSSGMNKEGALDVYVQPYDGRQRFVQVAGTLTVDATLLPPAGDSSAGASAVTLGTVTLGPRELREAYRSTFMGTHYAVVVPSKSASVPNHPAGSSMVIRAVFEDAVTGAKYEATMVSK